jgi:hypothetical protein
MTITDKELKRLLSAPTASYALTAEDRRLVEVAPELARELLAARKVVRMTRALAEGGTGSRIALTKALDAYDRARKGAK